MPEENMTEDRTQEMDTFPLGDIQSETVALHNTGYPDDDIREASNGDTQSPPETSEADPGEGFSEEAEEAAGSDDQEETQDMPQGISPQARIRELMSIPDNHKTEAQWDELIELEIAMAQGGRLLNLPAKQQKPGGKSSHGGQHPGQHNKNQKKPGHRPGGHPAQTQGQDNGGGGKPSGGQNKKFGRRFHKKPPKPAAG
ncbi:MAG: hypothetical protein AB1421_06790 [Pseudomonadota bacterium]